LNAPVEIQIRKIIVHVFIANQTLDRIVFFAPSGSKLVKLLEGLPAGVALLSGQKYLPEVLGYGVLIGGLDLGLNVTLKMRYTFLMTGPRESFMDDLIKPWQPIGDDQIGLCEVDPKTRTPEITKMGILGSLQTNR
jgi:hypothetical protein